jgi:hypothetical protein
MLRIVTGQIYIRVSYEDDQQHQIVIYPPIYCTLKGFIIRLAGND